ncbi:MAG: hypothetical protein IOC37_07570, partial [Burkholderia sp.]|nr:hypothetical protein [Burkholderia sp.]
RGDAAAFRQAVGQAAIELMRDPGTPAGTLAGREHARARVDAWTSRILALRPHARAADEETRCEAPAPR